MMKNSEQAPDAREAELREPASADEIKQLLAKLEELPFGEPEGPFEREENQFRTGDSYQIGYSLDVERISADRFLIRSEQEDGTGSLRWALYGIDGNEARQLASGGYEKPYDGRDGLSADMDFDRERNFEVIAEEGERYLKELKEASEYAQAQKSRGELVAETFRSSGFTALSSEDSVNKGTVDMIVKSLEAEPGAAWS